MVEHWLDKARREHRFFNLNGHYNHIRISAANMLKLVEMKNEMLGTKRTLHEESTLAQERWNAI